MPDVVRSVGAEDDESGSAEELIGIVSEATAALLAARETEGDRLAVIVRERIVLLSATMDRIAARAPERVAAHRDRLRENVRALLDGHALDEQRLAQEVAVLAERFDVGEEIDRFRTHLAAFLSTLGDAGTGGVGKRLGFLLQELLREANTVGSKGSDAPMQADVVALKEELERIREQVENLE